MRMHRMIFAGLAVFALGACERHDTQPTGTSGAPSSNRSGGRAARTPPAPADKTAMDQSQAAQDIRITADIRRAIMEDKSMSTAAQNCTIVTEHGVVTLRGEVGSAAEKEAVASKASAVAGVTRVDNQLEIKPG